MALNASTPSCVIREKDSPRSCSTVSQDRMEAREMFMNGDGGTMTVCDGKEPRGMDVSPEEDGFPRDLRRKTEPTAEGLGKEGR